MLVKCFGGLGESRKAEGREGGKEAREKGRKCQIGRSKWFPVERKFFFFNVESYLK